MTKVLIFAPTCRVSSWEATFMCARVISRSAIPKRNEGLCVVYKPQQFWRKSSNIICHKNKQSSTIQNTNATRDWTRVHNFIPEELTQAKQNGGLTVKTAKQSKENFNCKFSCKYPLSFILLKFQLIGVDPTQTRWSGPVRSELIQSEFCTCPRNKCLKDVYKSN